MTAQEVLAKAADMVERGWTQKLFKTEDGSVCAVGAITYAERPLACAMTLSAVGTEALGALLREIGKSPFRGWGAIVDWNDSPGRTAIEVATAMRNAKRWLEDG